MAGNQDENATLCGLSSKDAKHFDITLLKEQALALRCLNDVVLEYVLVIEKQPDCVKLVQLQKIKVPLYAVLGEAIRRSIVGL